MTAEPWRIDELRAQANYHRQRAELYRAKSYGPRATTPTRLRELERTAAAAEARLRHALAEQARHDAGSGDPS